jgi:nicotinamidase-related amidase
MPRLLAVILIGLAAIAVAQDDAAEPVTALVIIDIQAFYFPGGAMALVDPEPASANAGRVLAAFRERGDLVVHVRHQARQGMAIHADVAPHDGEAVITKQQVNAFRDTELLEVLREHGVTHLVLVGMQTHMCLEAATRAAADLGFACTVVGDACATRDLTYGDQTVPAAQVHAATLATLQAYAEVTDTDGYLSR